MVRPNASQNQNAVVTLHEDARQVCQERIDGHHHRGPGRIPQIKNRSAAEHAPMGPLAATRFERKAQKVFRMARCQPAFGKCPPNPACPVRQESLPFPDAKHPAVQVGLPQLTSRRRAVYRETALRQVQAHAGNRELKDRPADDIGGDRDEVHSWRPFHVTGRRANCNQAERPKRAK